MKVAVATALAPLECGGVFAVMKLLNHALAVVIQRAAKTSALNAAAVVADGSFPVGDAIALAADVGFLIWTGADLYKISRDLPPTIESQIRSGVVEAFESALAAFDQQAQEWLKRSSEERHRALAPVLTLVS
jgi:hypothetical protein